MKLYTHSMNTPCGELILAVDEAGALVRVVFPNEHADWAKEAVAKRHTLIEDAGRCAHVVSQLEEYFQGKRNHFDLTLRPEGTDFQRSVWQALQSIPFGKTITYKELAVRIGNPSAVRAVGRANGSNPIPIIIPCHRVIGADGSLTGFGGGLPLKEYLLTLEGVPVRSQEPMLKQLALV